MSKSELTNTANIDVKMKNTIEATIIEFCREFIEKPYLCYTEHGLHARFYYLLSIAFSNEGLPLIGKFQDKDVCLIQKEYPTEGNLGKARRQNWDISIIDYENARIEAIPGLNNKQCDYDYLKLHSVIEFGLNAGVERKPDKNNLQDDMIEQEHLFDDIDRLSKTCHVKNKYIIHTYRLSKGNSSRDWSPDSTLIFRHGSQLNINESKKTTVLIQEELGKHQANDIEVYYCCFNSESIDQIPVLKITSESMKELTDTLEWI